MSWDKPYWHYATAPDEGFPEEPIPDRLTKALELIEEMVGLDKGPYEDEYVAWNEKAHAFLKKQKYYDRY